MIGFTPDTLRAYTLILYIANSSSKSLMKVTLAGNGVLTRILQNNRDLPKSFALTQIYPNPFNPATAIIHQLPVNSLDTLRVYNILAWKIATLVNGKQNAGDYNATFNAANLSSGVYFCRLHTGTYINTKRLLLLK